MKVLAALMIAFPTFAFAAEPEKSFTLQLSPTDVVYIGKLLGQQPYNDVQDLISRIQRQVNEQTAPKAPEVKPEVK